MVKCFFVLIQREFRLAFRAQADTIGCILFFILCGALFPLALGPTPSLLHHIGPGVIWVCSLLASLLPLERMFHLDYEDGSLDLLMLTPMPPSCIAFAKIISHWLTSGLPLLLASCVLALLFSLSFHELSIMFISLTLGSLSFSLIGGMVAASMLGARRSNIVIPLLVLPLSTPILIFGTLSSYASQMGGNITANICFLGACFCIALPCCPFAAGMGLREACR